MALLLRYRHGLPTRPQRPVTRANAIDWLLAVVRWARQSVLYWAFNALFLPTVLVALLTTKGPRRHHRATWLVNWWGRTTLRIFSVRLVIEPAAALELGRRRRRVLTFNHSSTLDICLMTALWPPGGVAVVKRELLHLPLMGQAIALLDFLPLDRGNAQVAQASLHAAAERMRQDDLTVMIAPEGTRSPDGSLQAFKLGAFHLAAGADAPIVPLVLHGVPQIWPRAQWYARPGVVTARILPDRDSGALDPDSAAMHLRATQLRQDYLAALHAMDAP